MNKKYLAFLFLFVIGVMLFAPYCNVVNANGYLPPGWREDAERQAKGAEDWAEKISIGTVGKWILSAFIGGAAIILLLVTQGIMELGQILLAWVTSEGFINIPFTHDNLFVDTGWGIMRGLTNIFIVLGLVVIALATILRIESYQMKKTLPLLLIVALLINFTPMLCGLVIDASNIIMNHFLKAGLFLTQSYDSAIDAAEAELWGQIDSPSGMLATGLLLVGSSLFSGIIFLLFALLFLFRYIALWMLVILSPLAFFCLIFPGTKKIWDQWLNQFIQWCFIGIPAAFTIYLANMMTQQILQGELLGEISSMGKILGYIVPVAFLAGGLFMSLQTGAMGASIATGWFKKGGALVGKATARRTAGPAAALTAKGIGGLARKTEKVPLLKWVTRGLETATVPALIEYAAKQRKIKKPENWDGLSIPEKEIFITGKGMAQDQLILASEMKEEGTLQKSSTRFQEKMLKVANKFRKDPRYLKEVGDIDDAFPDKVTKEMKIDFEMTQIDPKAIDKATGQLKRKVEREKLELKIQGIIKEFKLKDDEEGKAEDKAAGVLHAQGLKPKNISKVAKSSLKTDTFRLAMRKMKSSNLQALRNSFDAETIGAVLDEGKGLNTINKEELKAIAKDNKDLVRWAYNTPAGKETLNWTDNWDYKEIIPPRTKPPTTPPTPKIVTPGTKEFRKTEEGLKKPRGRPGIEPSPPRGRPGF